MAIREIVTLGFGASSPVNFIPTIGFGGASLSPPDVAGIEFTAPGNALHFTVGVRPLHYTAPSNPLHFTRDEN
jgi:hypothetical protein